MSWYNRAKTAINVAVPFLVPTQATNLALLVSAILKKRTPSVSRSSLVPTPPQKSGGSKSQSTTYFTVSRG